MIKILLKSNYIEMQEYIKELEKANDDLECEVSARRSTINYKEQQIQKHERNYNELDKRRSKEITNLNKEINSANEFILQLQETTSKLHSDNIKLKQINTEIKARIGGLTASNNKLRKENKELDNKITIQANKISELLSRKQHTLSDYANDGQPKHVKKTRQELKK